MNDEKELFSLKYKKHQKRLILFLMIILLIFGALSIGFGLFISIYNYSKVLVIIGIIMVIIGVFDIPLAIKFYKYGVKKIDSYSKEEAYKRYCKVYGINTIKAKDDNNEKNN